MKKTLINHSGIIQWKFLISNNDELLQYAKHKSIAIGEEFRQFIYKDSDKPDTNTQKVLKLTSQANRISLVSSCDVLLYKVMMSMQKCISKGETLVVNQAGGYCPWDDSQMTLVKETEENIRIADGKEPLNQITANLNDGPILVLENQSEIPDMVEEYIHLTLGVLKFSYIKNIQFDKEKMPELIKEALSKQHHTFVVQTTLIDTTQIKDIVKLMENIPYKVNFLINSSEGVEKTLTDLIGADRTQVLYEKHTIIQW